MDYPYYSEREMQEILRRADAQPMDYVVRSHLRCLRDRDHTARQYEAKFNKMLFVNFDNVFDELLKKVVQPKCQQTALNHIARRTRYVSFCRSNIIDNTSIFQYFDLTHGIRQQRIMADFRRNKRGGRTAIAADLTDFLDECTTSIEIVSVPDNSNLMKPICYEGNSTCLSYPYFDDLLVFIFDTAVADDDILPRNFVQDLHDIGANLLKCTHDDELTRLLVRLYVAFVEEQKIAEEDLEVEVSINTNNTSTKRHIFKSQFARELCTSYYYVAKLFANIHTLPKRVAEYFDDTSYFYTMFLFDLYKLFGVYSRNVVACYYELLDIRNKIVKRLEIDYIPNELKRFMKSPTNKQKSIVLMFYGKLIDLFDIYIKEYSVFTNFSWIIPEKREKEQNEQLLLLNPEQVHACYHLIKNTPITKNRSCLRNECGKFITEVVGLNAEYIKSEYEHILKNVDDLSLDQYWVRVISDCKSKNISIDIVSQILQYIFSMPARIPPTLLSKYRRVAINSIIVVADQQRLIANDQTAAEQNLSEDFATMVTRIESDLYSNEDLKIVESIIRRENHEILVD